MDHTISSRETATTAVTANEKLNELMQPTARIDAYMKQWVTERPLPENLRDAIIYSLLGPGKRLRPLLTIHSCQAAGGNEADAMAPAAALEMIHAFSLVHDDLPAMDDDDLRRGRPTLHRHTNEAMAILAGDALSGLALELVSTRVAPPERAAVVCAEIASACNDMIAGQVHDTLPCFSESLEPLERLRTIHRNKTGALIRAACRVGAICAGADAETVDRLTRYGEAIGLMFQVVDDLLDVTQTTQHLGKTAGKDIDQKKLTYPALIGLDGTRKEVERLRQAALAELRGLDGNDVTSEKSRPLQQLCDYLAVRTR